MKENVFKNVMQIYLNENKRNVWPGTQTEKLPRGPLWVQWSPYTGGDMTIVRLSCGVGGSWGEAS